ncbi:MAG: leucine-rich repeat protein [Methanomassiliicoccaceae archaeon]|nr:leucine-rich repeat protein [Methanomassiliicoccaceae archaeon]
MKKNVLAAAVLVILMTAGAFVLVSDDDSSAAPTTITIGDFTFEYDPSAAIKEATLISYNANADKVTIPNEIVIGGTDVYPVTAIADLAFYPNELMKEVIMGNNVVKIGNSAFRDCTALKSLDLKNVTAIGNYSFFNCLSLTEITAEELITVGDFAFAISPWSGGSPYTGDIPVIATLSLPKVTTIGVGAFGAVTGTSLARDFSKVILPECTSIGNYAFSKATIKTSLSIPKAVTIGDYAFYFNNETSKDDATRYSLSVENVTSIGAYAFSGRALSDIALPLTAPYTIGKYAFQHTNLNSADLGMVTNIGDGAFDGIAELKYFVVNPSNGKYSSLISEDSSDKGVRGALYGLDGGDLILIKVPSRIDTQLINNKFTVADGVERMNSTAFDGCPAIEVDLNEIKEIPDNAFTKTRVLGVTATNASYIGVGAFLGCGSLSYFEFLDTGGSLTIGNSAFKNTGLTKVYLPKKTTVGNESFSNLQVMAFDSLVIGVWGDTVIKPDSFSGTTMYALQVSSDAATKSGAEAIFNGWNNVAKWTYGGSEKTGLLIINNTGPVDISNLLPDGQGRIEIRNFTGLATGTLQFVENKNKKTPPFHMKSVKPGIYGPEADGTSASPIDIMPDISGTGTRVGTCYKNDGVTWELILEYYIIDFYSFPNGDHDGDGDLNDVDPDYDDLMVTSSILVSDRTLYGSLTYLAGEELKTMEWPEFVRFSLKGWYTADNAKHGSAVFINTTNDDKITAVDRFGFTIDESLIYRDPVTDQGILNLYALFIGKEYTIKLETRLTSGHTDIVPAVDAANPVGGSVELILDPSIPLYSGFSTGTKGFEEASYPYGTGLILKATPNAGYAFVGWGILDTTDEDHPVWTYSVRDRMYVNPALSVAEWPMSLQSGMKFVAYFAKTVTVTFDPNDGNPSTNVIMIVGDDLVEPNNDYDSFDYYYIAKFTLTNTNTGKGTSYYPGTPSQTGLTFGGWYGNPSDTCYAAYDAADPMGDLSYLKAFVAMPNVTSLTLKARWYAEITFYADNGVNGTATMAAASGLAETSPGSGVYTYQHNVGTWSGGGYTAALPSTLVPTASDVNFNGWYVLDGGITVSHVANLVLPKTNKILFYPDLYPTKERFEADAPVQGDMKLMALYSANVEFYFNDAVMGSAVITASPYTMAVPVSHPLPTYTLFGDTIFDTVKNEMVNAQTTGPIYKEDAKFVRMHFLGWYVYDGTNKPAAGDTKYDNLTTVTQNVKLIAGWGFEITFDDGGLAGIVDQTTMSTWVPGSYHFLVLEGTAFEMTGTGMPKIKLSGSDPTSWFDANSTPYEWFTNGPPTIYYTYSVELTPEFRDLFRFNIMGGSPSMVMVPYDTSTDTFADMLDRLNTSLFDGTSYVALAKTGLYYKTTGTPSAAGEPNAVWYKNGGVVPDYISGGLLTEWAPGDSITTDTVAYIRWLADVAFDMNGGSSAPPATITVDEGTPFNGSPFENAPPGSGKFIVPLPTYNAANDKTFKGWLVGSTEYVNQTNDIAYTGNVTSSITLKAKWGVEVKFYFTGNLEVPYPVGTVTHGTETIGTDTFGYIIVDVSDLGTVTAPTLSKTGFHNNYVKWYKASDAVSLTASGLSTAPAILSGVTTNTTLYGKWYAVVDFNVGTSANPLFTGISMNLLEGSKLSDLISSPSDSLNPYVAKTDWNFVGWYDRTGISDPNDYEDFGTQYYTTGFLYLPSVPSDSTSSKITKDVTLDYEFVVLVEFDSGYSPGVTIAPQYLRVEKPLPSRFSTHSDRFTDAPSRAGVAFTGWWDLSVTPNDRYADGTAEPTGLLVLKPMKLTATWLVKVSFFDLPAYLSDGLWLNVSGKITQDAGVDGILNTRDDFFLMPEGTLLRELILTDPTPGGMTFISWFVELGTVDGYYASGDILYKLTDKFVGDIMLTAGYGFVLHFNTNGGTPSSIPDMLVIEGQSINLPEKPAKGRLTFTGWYDGSAKNSAGALVTPTSETWYTAKWQVEIKLYDSISMTPVASFQWDEDVGPGSIGFTYNLVTSGDYGGNAIKVEINWTGAPAPVTVEKFIDKYDPSVLGGWTSLYSVFNGWLDPFTGTHLSPTADLSTLFAGATDSAALFATWNERVRFYDGGTLVNTQYVDSGTYLGTVAPSGIAGWADLYSPLNPLNPATYRIRDSGDFLKVDLITVTFDGNGGTPLLQTFSNVVSGTMLGAIGANEPMRSGMYFAGWYSGSTRLSFTDKLYNDTALTARWSSTPVEQYAVFAFADTHTSISPSGMIKAMRGDTVSFDFRAETGYKLVVVIDGKEINSDGLSSYTFSNINSDHSIVVRAASGGPSPPIETDTQSGPTVLGGGNLAILNLVFMVLCIMISIIALTVTYKRNYEGTGTGKGLRLGAVLIAVISFVIFLLTEGFGGTYVAYDSWTAVMLVLLVATVALVLASLRYDYIDD